MVLLQCTAFANPGRQIHTFVCYKLTPRQGCQIESHDALQSAARTYRKVTLSPAVLLGYSDQQSPLIRSSAPTSLPKPASFSYSFALDAPEKKLFQCLGCLLVLPSLILPSSPSSPGNSSSIGEVQGGMSRIFKHTTTQLG